MTLERLPTRIILLVFVTFILIENNIFSQDSSIIAQSIYSKTIYAIITGQETKADSLINEFSEIVSNKNKSSDNLYINLKSLYAIFFHYDYLLDSLHEQEPKTDNPEILHLN